MENSWKCAYISKFVVPLHCESEMMHKVTKIEDNINRLVRKDS